MSPGRSVAIHAATDYRLMSFAAGNTDPTSQSAVRKVMSASADRTLLTDYVRVPFTATPEVLTRAVDLLVGSAN